MKGKIYVIEGLDGSGKATQAEAIAKALSDEGRNVTKISFPDYDAEASIPVRMYLRGEFGKDPADVNAYAASTFFAVDRYASFKTQGWGDVYRNGGIVIADRYIDSNAIHQCSKLPREDWEKFLAWLYEYENGLLGIPAADKVFYLDVEPEISQALMAKRYSGDESRKDIHEANIAYQLRCREAAEFCAERLGWTRIKCSADGQMRGIHEISALILDSLHQELKN